MALYDFSQKTSLSPPEHTQHPQPTQALAPLSALNKEQKRERGGGECQDQTASTLCSPHSAGSTQITAYIPKYGSHLAHTCSNLIEHTQDRLLFVGHCPKLLDESVKCGKS